MSLNTRIKRKKELREEYVQQEGLIFKLPDEVLLSIFKYFEMEELILAAGVCKWFRSIAYDEEFWTTINLRSKSYSARVLLKFLHRFPRDCTEELKISGRYLNHKFRTLLYYTEQINVSIQKSYPNLRHLHISHYDFQRSFTAVKNVTYLPSNLRSLHLTHCEMVVRSFSDSLTFLQVPNKPLKNSTSFRQLEILSLENSSCLTSESIGYLPELCPKLIELNLNGCFRLIPTETFVNSLLSYSETLRRLYLSETKINDNTMHSICRQMKRLNVLDISFCRDVTVNIVENLLTLKQLQKLSASNAIQNLYQQRKDEDN